MKQLFLFETDIANANAWRLVAPLLDAHPMVLEHHIDLEDRQRVLRVTGGSSLRTTDVVHLLSSLHYSAELLS